MRGHPSVTPLIPHPKIVREPSGEHDDPIKKGRRCQILLACRTRDNLSRGCQPPNVVPRARVGWHKVVEPMLNPARRRSAASGCWKNAILPEWKAGQRSFLLLGIWETRAWDSMRCGCYSGGIPSVGLLGGANSHVE